MVGDMGRLRGCWDDDPVLSRRLASVQREADRLGMTAGDQRDRMVYRAAEWDARFDRRLDISWLAFVSFACGVGFAYLLSAAFGWPI